MRVTFLQTNFTAGELSPRLYGRVDLAKYANAAKRLRNAIVWKYGGVRRRYGSRFVKPTKIAAQRARLIPFIFSRQDAYILEFGNNYMRVYKNGVQVESNPGVAYELATPFTAQQALEMDYAQGADSMFLYHGDVPTQRLVRLADARWQIGAVEWVQQPTDEIGHRFPGVSMTLSDATVGQNRTATATGGNVFLVSDIGRILSYDGGVAKIVGVTSATVATVDITRAFTTTSLPAGAWLIEGSPRTGAKPFERENQPTAGKVITIATGSVTGVQNTLPNSTAVWAAGTVTMTCLTHVFNSGEWILVEGVTPDGYNGLFQITVIDSNTYTYALPQNPGGNGAGGTSSKAVGLVTPAWRSADVGSIVRINGGAARILTVHNSVSVRAKVLQPLASLLFTPSDSWALELAMWSDVLGYPRTGTFYEQRHVVAGSRSFPTTVWGSVVKEPLNFELGTDDDKAFAFAIASDQINPIAYLSPGRALVVLTYGGEYTMHGGIEKPIAPTNAQIRPRSTHGCALVRPVRNGPEHIFVGRSGREMRALGYNVTNDDYVSAEISVLSEHLMLGFSELAYQRVPDTILWAVRNDGKLLACTYDRDASVEVVAWALHETDGVIESVACIPADTVDQTWVIVRRTINGNQVRYVERLDPDVHVDSAVTATNGSGATVWSGLGHLEGKSVAVVADGAYAGRFTVVSGAITLPRPAFNVTIGLPFVTEIELLDPEMSTAAGSAFGNSMRSGELTLRLLDSVGGSVNGQLIPTRRTGDNQLDTPPITQSGLFRIENLGWARGESPVVISHDLPFRFQLLAVGRKFTVND